MFISLRTQAGIALVVGSLGLGLGCGGSNHSSKTKVIPNNTEQTSKEKKPEVKKGIDAIEDQNNIQNIDTQDVTINNDDNGHG